MRAFGNKKTHASNGQELSDIFIAEDDTLTVYFNEDEAEITGGKSDCFGDALLVKIK